MRDGRRRGARLVAIVIGVAAVGGCGEVVSIDEFEQATGVGAPVQPPPSRTPEVIGGGSTFDPGDPAVAVSDGGAAARPTEPDVGFGDGARVVDAALAGLPGERALVQVVLYDGYGIVVSHGDSGDVDRVVVRSAGAEAPRAMPDALVHDPDGQRYPASALDWSIIPDLVERTPGELGIDGGVVSHVIVEKNVPFSPDLVIRVYVSTERRSGRIDYFADGRLMRVFAG